MSKIISLKELYNIMKNKIPKVHKLAQINTLNALAGGTVKRCVKKLLKVLL